MCCFLACIFFGASSFLLLYFSHLFPTLFLFPLIAEWVPFYSVHCMHTHIYGDRVNVTYICLHVFFAEFWILLLFLRFPLFFTLDIRSNCRANWKKKQEKNAQKWNKKYDRTVNEKHHHHRDREVTAAHYHHHQHPVEVKFGLVRFGSMRPNQMRTSFSAQEKYAVIYFTLIAFVLSQHFHVMEHNFLVSAFTCCFNLFQLIAILLDWSEF